MKREKWRVDLTQGPIAKQILRFAMPLLGSSLVQQLYNTVDLLYIGRNLGKDASAAVGASTMMVTCLIGLFGGLATGAGVVLAAHFGAKNQRKMRDTIHTSAAVSLICGAVIMVAGYLFAPVFIRLLGTPQQIRGSAVSYLRIYFLSTFFIVSYNMGSGLLRAMGEAMIPLLFQFAGGLINILVDGIFVLGFHLGVNGVAWATFFSQGAAAILTLWYLSRRLPRELRLSIRDIRIRGKVLKRILKIGIPAGLQTLVIALSNVIAQYHINSLGTTPIAAFTAYFKVELPIYLPIVAVGQAAMTFVGQNLGAKQIQRTVRGVRVCLMLCIGITAALSLLLLWGGRYAFGLFNPDAEVIAAGRQIIRVSFPFYFLYAILEIYGDAAKGAGRAKIPMMIILLNICLIRSLLLFLLVPRMPGIRTVAFTYPVTWFLTAAAMAIYYAKQKKGWK